jgi:hypothetical protein
MIPFPRWQRRRHRRQGSRAVRPSIGGLSGCLGVRGEQRTVPVEARYPASSILALARDKARLVETGPRPSPAGKIRASSGMSPD